MVVLAVAWEQIEVDAAYERAALAVRQAFVDIVIAHVLVPDGYVARDELDAIERARELHRELHTGLGREVRPQRLLVDAVARLAHTLLQEFDVPAVEFGISQWRAFELRLLGAEFSKLLRLQRTCRGLHLRKEVIDRRRRLRHATLQYVGGEVRFVVKLRQLISQLERLLEDLEVLLTAFAVLRHPDTFAGIGVRRQFEKRQPGRIVHPQYKVALVVALALRNPRIRHAGRLGRRNRDGRAVLIDVLLKLQSKPLQLVDELLGTLALLGRQCRATVLELFEEVLLVDGVRQVLRLDGLHPLEQCGALVELGLERQQFLQAGPRGIARDLVRGHVLQQVDWVGEVARRIASAFSSAKIVPAPLRASIAFSSLRAPASSLSQRALIAAASSTGISGFWVCAACSGAAAIDATSRIAAGTFRVMQFIGSPRDFGLRLAAKGASIRTSDVRDTRSATECVAGATKRRIAQPTATTGTATLRAGLLRVLALLPQHVTATGVAIQRACQHEQQIGEAVQVLARRRVDLLFGTERDHRTLGAPADGAADGPAQCPRARTARQDELGETRQRGVVVREPRIQSRDMSLLHHRVARDAEFAAQIEEIVLDIDEIAAASSGRGSVSSRPSDELSSSTLPIAATRRASLRVRVPSPRPVVPSSPVRVAIVRQSLADDSPMVLKLPRARPV